MKPREWVFWRAGNSINWSGPEFKDGDHVIEKSAYDREVERSAKLVQMLEAIDSGRARRLQISVRSLEGEMKRLWCWHKWPLYGQNAHRTYSNWIALLTFRVASFTCYKCGKTKLKKCDENGMRW